MSLGLGDLKKKKAPATAKNVLKSEAARPWSPTGLGDVARPSKGRKKHETSNVAMCDEGPSLHAAPLFYIELAGDSRLAQVEETLVKIEERVVRALEGPLKAAQLFFPKFFAQ